eukprot:5102748-Amphidinium_carterae.1
MLCLAARRTTRGMVGCSLSSSTCACMSCGSIYTCAHRTMQQCDFSRKKIKEKAVLVTKSAPQDLSNFKVIRKCAVM